MRWPPPGSNLTSGPSRGGLLRAAYLQRQVRIYTHHATHLHSTVAGTSTCWETGNTTPELGRHQDLGSTRVKHDFRHPSPPGRPWLHDAVPSGEWQSGTHDAEPRDTTDATAGLGRARDTDMASHQHDNFAATSI